MSDPDYSQAVRADSVEHEARIIHAQPCACGGRLAIRGQRLLSHGGSRFDLMTAECVQCKRGREFLFNIDSFFGKHTAESTGLPPPGPTRGQIKMALWMCALLILVGAAMVFSPLATAESLRPGIALIVIFAVFIVLGRRRLSQMAAPADIAAAQREIDGGTAADMEAVLAEHGVALNWSETDAQTALTGGMAKASLYRGCRSLDQKNFDEALGSFTRVIALYKNPAASASVVAAALHLRGLAQ